MKKTRIYFLLILFTTLGFVLGIVSNSIFTKSYANERKTDAILPIENTFEVMASGTSRSADYDIVTIYGRKYIIFSNGSDIEVLNY